MTYKVLVADDELEGRVMVKEAIAGEDCSVVVVADGREALEKATSEDFDLVIMDLIMPGMDGTEALRIIHMSEPDLPIIVVTGADTEEMRAEALRAGANLVITKPYELMDLVSAVRKLLGIGQ